MLFTRDMTRTSASGSALAALEGARYLSLTTYRRNGDPVATPVWFAGRGGVLYVHTLGGKVKRIRHTPNVTLAACTVNGRVTGHTVPAVARVVENPSEAAAAEAVLAAKYGIVRRIYYAAQRLRQKLLQRAASSSSAEVYLAIEPAQAAWRSPATRPT